MTAHELPAAGTTVEMTASADPVDGVRVVQAEGSVLTLSMAPAAVPEHGATVTLRWPAGPRGRWAMLVEVIAIHDSRIDVKPVGTPDIEQHRSYVRGGGGEQVLLRQPGRADVVGWIHDLSEQGIRAHFADVELAEGDQFRLRIELIPDAVELAATAVKVGSLRQRIPHNGPMSVELVAVFATDELQATVIRRYVLRQQLLARGRGIPE